MDPIHRRVLANKTTTIMGRISPTVFSVYLKQIFSTSDMEGIAAKETQMGATHGTQTMLSLLEKRGPTAFPLFITALREYEIKLYDLADELEAEERKLRGGTAEAPIQRAQNLPPSGEPVDMYGDAGMSSPPPAPVLQNCRSENDNGRISDFSQEPAPVSKEPPAAEMNNQAHQEVVLSLDTFVKDIPYHLCTRIEKLLDPPNPNRHDWRGMAGAMNLSTDEVRQLESVPENGKMKGLIDRMIHTQKTVNDLLGWLKRPEVERLDVIDEIRKEPNNIPADAFLTETDKSSENQQSAAADVTSPDEKVDCSPAAKYKSTSILQECSHEPHKNKKPDARIPSQILEESDDVAKANGGQPEVHNSPDSQMEDKNNEDKPDYQMPNQEKKNMTVSYILMMMMTLINRLQ
ncbi:hypothetical protein OS493_020095 [Desmophyllum pertusum]|uniref:CARD domain-containing protein n=1 Tax=Desmophyllum pertusum TaxID=174260 RepID=A0A9X0A142_9CNID|nr:hypothetical protein OS493_020095 [Desmophyllum pertusum]